MEETWTHRELPVLRALVQGFDDPVASQFGLDRLGKETGLAEVDVQRALRALHEASPPYIHGVETAETAYPVVVTGVTERARREAGQWPTPESWVDDLVAGLNTAADAEPNPDRKQRLRALASGLGGAMRDVAIEVAGSVLVRGAGL